MTRCGNQVAVIIANWLLLSCIQPNTAKLVLSHEQRSLDSITDLFFLEASLRSIDTSSWRGSIDVNFGTLPMHRAGSCLPDSYPKKVTLDHYYWKIAAPGEREQVLFHELAHCLLQRNHVTDTFRFGECKSWMRASNDDCLINLRNPLWRKYYLDELFEGPGVDTPAWYHGGNRNVDLPNQRQVHTRVYVPDSLLNTVLGNETHDWILDITSPSADSLSKWTNFGITLNELAFEYNNFNPHQLLHSSATLISGPVGHPLFKQNHGSSSLKLSIQKRNHGVYLFLDGSLKYCLPIQGNSVSIFQYASSPRYYRTEVYVLPAESQ